MKLIKLLGTYLEEKGIEFSWDLRALADPADVVIRIEGVNHKVYTQLVWPYALSLLDFLPKNWTLSESNTRLTMNKDVYDAVLVYEEKGIR